MRLRTTAGAYAGQIRDYDFGAARAALQSGTAERVEGPAPTPPASPPATAADGGAPVAPPASREEAPRRRRK